VKRIVVGISGATGAIYGVRIIEILAGLPDVETHVVVTDAARQTIALELDRSAAEILALADHRYSVRDVGAAIASGSYRAHGMIVAPCSMRSLSAIAYSRSDNLLTRAADVMLKERRPLVLLPRETPLHLGHLRAMTQIVEIGGIVMPPVPAFYTRPQTVLDIVNQTANRALDLLDIELPSDLFPRWDGGSRARPTTGSEQP
jgi:4-hydroxy-3-polyprenylbenzoate decarboxylase